MLYPPQKTLGHLFNFSYKYSSIFLKKYSAILRFSPFSNQFWKFRFFLEKSISSIFLKIHTVIISLFLWNAYFLCISSLIDLFLRINFFFFFLLIKSTVWFVFHFINSCFHTFHLSAFFAFICFSSWSYILSVLLIFLKFLLRTLSYTPQGILSFLFVIAF